MATYRTPVSYIDKSRIYYEAHGYEQPYDWASNTDAPFQPIERPLSELKIGVVTTAYPTGFTPPKKTYAQAVDPRPNETFTDDLAWDRDATHLNDLATYLPLDQLDALADDGVIGATSPRFYGVPTEYSQRRTGNDAQQIEEWVREDEVDLVLLVPL